MLAFTFAFSHMVFLHNADFQQATAAWFDSGSLLQDYLGIVGPPIDLNQTHRYHTGIYGWIYNSMVVWGIIALKAVFGGSELGFPVFAGWARSVSFFFTVAGVGLLFGTLRKYGASYVVALVATVVIAIFPSTVKFAYEVHPEPAGVFFVIVMLCALHHYCLEPVTREKYLLASWAAAVASVLAKQSFMIYPLAPLIAVFAISLSHPSVKGRKGRTLVRLAAWFMLVAVGLVLIFHPYAVLDFPGFLAKQKEIHAFHATLSMPVSASFKSWFNLLWHYDLWLLIAIAFALIRLLHNRFRGDGEARLLDIYCVLLLLFFALIVDQLRFYILRGYLVPILPAAVVILIGVPAAWRGAIKAVGAVAVMLVFVAAIPPYVVNTAGILSYDLALTSFNSMRIRQPLLKLGARPWVVFYSSSLSVPGQLYKQAIDNFKIGMDKDDIARAFWNLHPDLVIVDKAWRYATPDSFDAAAKANGLVLVAQMIGEDNNQWTCGRQFSYKQCIQQVMELFHLERFGMPQASNSAILFYAKPEMAPLFSDFR